MGRPDLKAIRTTQYVYVEYGNGERQLYDLRTDPYQLDNGYINVSQELRRSLEAQLDALRGCSGSSCKVAEDDDYR